MATYDTTSAKNPKVKSNTVFCCTLRIMLESTLNRMEQKYASVISSSMAISIAPMATGARKPTYERTSVCRKAASRIVKIVMIKTSTSISSWELLYLKPAVPPE
ncbi:hypothetical protein D3C73_1316570 [compost metagenome]